MNHQRGGLSRFAFVHLVLMAVVVTAFVADSVIDMRAYRLLVGQFADIAGNAMPSIAYITEARGTLRRMDEYLSKRISESGPDGSTRVPDGLSGLRQEFDAELTSYRDLPYFPGERALYAEVADARMAFDQSADDTIGAVVAGNMEGARSAFERALAASNRLDLALERIVKFNAAEGERVAQRVSSAWQTTTVRDLLVDVLVGLLAMSATVFSAVVWRRAVVAMQQRTSELDSFAGRVAHDVLSPLQAVSLGLAMSRARLAADPGALAIVDRSTRALERVRNLVATLLTFARAGGQPTEGAAEVSETIRAVLEGLEADAVASHVELALERSLERRVACAPGVLMSAVQNLVGNAIKYMDEAPTRRVAVRVSDNDAFVRVEVQDTGPGVPEVIRGKVFDPFVRGTDSVAGAGLGLATVKRLAEAHGGHVGCESAPGQGSLFWFELPRAPPSE